MFMISVNRHRSLFNMMDALFPGGPEKWNAKLMIIKILSSSFPYILLDRLSIERICY